MGWELIPCYTITDDFDKDFGVDEWHGTNAFARDGERISGPTSSTSGGDEAMEHPGATWTITALAARRSGRTRRRAIRRPTVRVVELPRRVRQDP